MICAGCLHGFCSRRRICVFQTEVSPQPGNNRVVSGVPRDIPRPLNMDQLVRCLERRYGPVDLVPGEGLTKLHVGGVSLSFLDAERLCLGETDLETLRARQSDR